LRAFRGFLAGLFSLSSISCLLIVARYVPRVLHSFEQGNIAFGFRRLLVPAVFLVIAVIFGMTGWTSFKNSRAVRAWGIAASLVFILLWALLAVTFWRYGHVHMWYAPFRYTGILLALGIGGLVAFSRRFDPAGFASETSQLQTVPGDGTSPFINRAYGFAAIAGTYGIYSWWVRWCWDRGIRTSAGNFLRGFLWLTLVALVLATIHELGHTLIGLALGMRLRAFAVGPFRCIVRDGKWEFRFDLGGILAVGGATGVVPANPNVPNWSYVCLLLAGPLANLCTGLPALLIAFSADARSSMQAGGLLALFGAFSLMAFAANLVPFRTGNGYSDGAQIKQLLSGGPWADYSKAVSVVTSSLVTKLRPRDYDLLTIQRAAAGINQGQRALLLRLYTYHSLLDQALMTEAGMALKEAESIYFASASDIPAELLTVFVFGNAYVLHDAAAARQWWDRMEAKKPSRFNVDYWRAKSAICWIEGSLDEADEAWKKSDEQARKLPEAGAYEFDRYCCSLLRMALDEALVAKTSRGRHAEVLFSAACEAVPFQS
jgi:Peptidase family M50